MAKSKAKAKSKRKTGGAKQIFDFLKTEIKKEAKLIGILEVAKNKTSGQWDVVHIRSNEIIISCTTKKAAQKAIHYFAVAEIKWNFDTLKKLINGQSEDFYNCFGTDDKESNYKLLIGVIMYFSELSDSRERWEMLRLKYNAILKEMDEPIWETDIETLLDL